MVFAKINTLSSVLSTVNRFGFVLFVVDASPNGVYHVVLGAF